jgi:hypothetical protein
MNPLATQEENTWPAGQGDITVETVYTAAMDLGLWRFLELVGRELDAQDARIEIGGHPPTDERCLWARVPRSDARVVAVFEQPPERRQELQARLLTLTESFSETVDRGTAPVSSIPFDGRTARARLDSELAALATRAGSDCAFVCDTSSPMIWGASFVDEPTRETSSDQLLVWAEQLRAERTEEMRAAHGHVVRLALDDREALVRLLGGLYMVVLVFGGALSEPVAVGALLHATPVIERLIVALPPVDPPPGGKVIRLPPRLR